MPEAATSSAKLKFATKTAISLTLAYMLPMAFGWPQPQTAAITVMLIAATGMLSESLQKGVLRVMGTVLGAVLGLSLIALFPQDRLLYLLCVSLVVSTLLYLYNAYQGDSTVFMLAAMVVMMVFNGGDAEGAFLYGVDRTLLTAFGVLVYTVVASLLWPVQAQDNTRELAAEVAKSHRLAFAQLVSGGTVEAQPLQTLLTKNEEFQSHFVAVRNDAEKIVNYQAEWDAIATCYETLDELLLPALQARHLEKSVYARHILNYDLVLANIQTMFAAIENSWQLPEHRPQLTVIAPDFPVDNLQEESHFTVAALVSRADLLGKLQKELLHQWQAINSLLFDESGFTPTGEYRGKPSFIWLDRENFKTAIRVFTSFWLATALWLHFNPPGGFMFVTLSTALVVLVSYTPIAPKLLYILFTLGFLFAVPAYLFLLPQMSHWLELAAFLFTYAFIGFYVFAGPISIFFLLGLMTLGIQNTMNYNFNVLLIVILLLYMVCTSLLVTVHFPFTSQPQKLFVSFRRRFFTTCEKIIAQVSTPSRFGHRRLLQNRLVTAATLGAKMRQWGGMLAKKQYPGSSAENISQYNFACTVLLEQLKILVRKNDQFSRNELIVRAQATTNTGGALASLCRSLAQPARPTEMAAAFEEVTKGLGSIEQRLGELLGDDYLHRYDKRQLGEFYLYLNLQASIGVGIVQCRNAVEALDWKQLQGNSF